MSTLNAFCGPGRARRGRGAAADAAWIDAPRAQGHVVEHLLAEGGMGAVYAARELASGERVALKVLRTIHARDVGLVSRFEREIAFASRVRHTNVVEARTHGHLEDGRPFYTMDLAAGPTLGALVRSHGPMPVAGALAIADEILAGLAAVHAAGIVHRDLQPDNVLVDGASTSRPTARLIDFGFAQEPGIDRGDGVTPDSPGAMVGTLRFMSPEQTTRSRAITERSDLFGAGMLLYYALTGALPFRGRCDREVAVAILRHAPLPLRRARPDAPRHVDDVLARALAKHPDARFESAAAMRAALR